MHAESPPVAYDIDEDDFILSVSPTWDEVALANGGPQVTSAHVIGTLFWRHVSGDNLRHVLRILFRRARDSRRPIAVLYQCNSPTTRRNMRLELHSIDGRQIRASSVLLSEAPLGVPSGGTSAVGSLRMCSWCNRFAVDDTWREFEEAVDAQRLLVATEPPDISHTMCPDCFGALDPAD